MEITRERPGDMYKTTNSAYGTNWESRFPTGATQQTVPRTGSTQRVGQDQPGGTQTYARVHNPAHPCGIQSMSNVPTNTRGEFTNVRHDYYANDQGLWANAMFNTPGATIERGVGTYSNLQGGWSRVGRSTYDSTHGTGTWVSKWGTYAHEPATLRSLYDHSNVDPRDNWVPIDSLPQNM